jgi:hypothetical protein
MEKSVIVLSCVWVTVDGVWNGNWIYWTLTDPWLQVIITISLIHTLYSSQEHPLKSSQSAVSGNSFQCCRSLNFVFKASCPHWLPTAELSIELDSRLDSTPDFLGLWDHLAICAPPRFFVLFAVGVSKKESRWLAFSELLVYRYRGIINLRRCEILNN